MNVDMNDLRFEISNVEMVSGQLCMHTGREGIQYVDGMSHGIKVTHLPTGITIEIPSSYHHTQNAKRKLALHMMEALHIHDQIHKR